MRKILLISYLFPPSGKIGAHRTARLARMLPELGYEVEVVTADLSQAGEPIDPSLLELVPPGTRVHRLPARFYFGRNQFLTPPTEGAARVAWWKVRGYAQMLLNPMDGVALWARDARRLGARLLRSGGYHAIVASGPPFSPLVAAADLSREFGVPLVADFRDLWAGAQAIDDPEPDWRSARLVRLNREMERRVLATASRAVFTSPEAADLYRSLYPAVDPATFTFVYNAFDAALPAAPAVAPQREGPVTLLHAGSLAYGRDAIAQRLLEAYAALRRDGEIGRMRFQFAGAGEGVIPRLAKAAGVPEDVEDLGWVPRERSLALQQEADVLLAIQSRERVAVRLAVPAKLFEYMIARKPLLGLFSSDCPAARIVREEGLGEVGADADPEELRGALRRIQRRVESGSPPPVPPAAFTAPETMRRYAGLLDEVALPAGASPRPAPRRGVVAPVTV